MLQTFCVADAIVADTVFDTIFRYRYQYPLLLDLYRRKYPLFFWSSKFRYFLATFSDFQAEIMGIS